MPTTTAAVIISDALKEILVIGEGEAPSATMFSDGLRMLNRLLDTFSNNNDFAYFASMEQKALTGQQMLTIGPTGDIVATRPIKVETAVVDRNGITYPVKVIDNEKYDDLTYKALAGANTQAVYYEATFPNGTLYLYPVASGCTLKIRVLNSVKQFASTSVNIDMPEGYEDAIMLALAIRMAPSYGKQVNPDTKQAARRAMNAIKVTNQVIPTMDLPDAVIGRSGSSFASFMSGG